jgi:hypothetical protein
MKPEAGDGGTRAGSGRRRRAINQKRLKAYARREATEFGYGESSN